MKKRFILLSILAVFVIAGLVYFFMLRTMSAPIPTVTVKQGDLTAKVTAVGSILPIKTVTIKSPISGTVEILFHEEGEFIKKGEPLLKVTPKPTPSDYATKKQNVAMDQVKLEKAKVDIARYRYLLKEGAIGDNNQDYDAAKQAYKLTQEQYNLDKQLLNLIKEGGRVLEMPPEQR
jgi:multidrug efflux pump subunit AcrA (membrane-fusion protein)